MIGTSVSVGKFAEYRFVFSLNGETWSFVTEDKNNNAGRDNARNRAWDDAREFVGSANYSRVTLKSVAKIRSFD